MAEVSSEYWAYNDPRWANDPAYGNPEAMKYVGPWEQVLQATGFKGKLYEPIIEMQPSEYGGFVPQEVGKQYTAEAKSAIDNLRASGYDLRWKHPDKRTFNTYYGFVTPSGEVQDIKIAGSDLGDAIMPMIKVFGAGLGLAGLGAGINSLLGGAGAGVAPANALAMDLAGGSADLAGALGGGQFAAAGGLPLTAADLASLPADVLGQINPIPQFEVANFPSLGDRNVTNVLAQGTQGAEAAALPQVTAPAEATVPSLSTRPPLSVTPMELTPLEPFPVATSGPVTVPKFDFRELANFPVSAAGATTSAPAGIMEGIVPGGLTGAGIPATATEIAATNSLLAGLGAGAGAANAGAGLSAEALDAALAGGAPVGATTGTASLGGVGLPELTAAPAAAATGAGAAGGGAGIAEGMVPGGLTSAGIPATLPEAAAAGAIAAGAGAGGGSVLDQVMSFFKSPAGGAALSGLGSVIGGITQANAAEAAANQQAEAARNALALQREMFEYQKGLLEPYRTAGTAALKRLEGALGLGGPAQPQQMLEMDPGYGFRLGEGLKALERMQAARGSMLSGGAMKAGQRYAQDYASGEYGNAYNRLANIAGLGQTVGGQLGTAAQQFSTNAGNVMGQEANALAAGRIGRGSAYGNAIQGGLNAYSNYLNQQQQNQLFRDIFGRTAIGG